jgi:uncharacterized protein YndB with AHSA1/START domain
VSGPELWESKFMARSKLAIIGSVALLAGALGGRPAASTAPFDGPPQISVDVEPGGGAAAVVHAQMDVAAPPGAVWAVLFDCAGAPRYEPGLISCTVLNRGPGWEEREHRLKGPIFHPVIVNRFRLDFQENQRLGFRRTGGDWKRSDGEWRLTSLAGGKATHVAYILHFAIDAPISSGMLRDGIAKGMPKSLHALRREALRRAGGR